jgi:Fe-S cluster biogenesis protein NfuA
MSATEKEAMIAQVNAALESVRPHLAADGGNVEVVDITDDNIVKVKWLGNCQSCSMSYMTMKAGLEQTIKGRMPHISGVEAINGM